MELGRFTPSSDRSLILFPEEFQMMTPTSRRISVSIRLMALAGTLLSTIACGIPAEVYRIDKPSSTPTEGVRYLLKNPAYKVSLEFKSETAQGERSFDVILEQALEGETVYEIRPRGGWFSDTEVAIVLDADAKLSSLTAGETDKIGDFLTAVLGMVVTAGVAALNQQDEALRIAKYQDRLKKLEEYVTNAKELKSRQEAIETRLKALRKDLAVPAATSHKAKLEDIQSLETGLDKVKAEIKESRFKLEAGEIIIKLNGNVVHGTGNDAWVTFDLKRIQ